MRAGDLRHSVIIQKHYDPLGAPPPTEDARYGLTYSWETHATVFAAISPISGRERMLAGQVEDAEADYRVRVRYLSTVTPAMRVLWGSRVFNIRAVMHTEERSRETVLLVKEKLD